MSVTALRPRSITEIVDAALHLLRQQYLQLVTATAAVCLPVLVLRLLLPAPLSWVPPLFYVLAQSIATGAVIVMVADSYLGRRPSVAGALREVGAHIGALVGTSVLQALLVLTGFVLLIVPGFIFLAWFFAAPMVVVLEDAGAVHALRHSRELVRGHTPRVLGALLLVILLYLVLAGLLGATAGVLGAFGPGAADTALAALVDGAMRILLAPILAVVFTLLYYDLRIRREGFDLQVMAAELDHASPGPRGLSPEPLR